MVRPAATSPSALILATAAVLSAGCFDTSSTLTTTDYPTRLTVDPLMFRGSLTCGAPGLESYVVTLKDVYADDNRGSRTTDPVDCENQISFGDTFIVSAHYYVAKIDGYDREVIAQDVPGVGRKIVDASSPDQEVLPKWTTTCGEVPPPAVDSGDDVAADAPTYNELRFPTRALGQTEVIVHGCLPLAPIDTPDASTDDGGADGAVDGGVPTDASAETSDATEPDGPGPGDGDDEGGTTDDGAAGDGAAGEGGRR
jgi:hypothetical protein